jgi:hypothetical protein
MPVPRNRVTATGAGIRKPPGNELAQSPLPGNVQPILVAGSISSLDSPAFAEFLRMRQVAIGTFRSLAAHDTYELIPQASMTSVSHTRGATLGRPASPREGRHEMIGGRR